MYSKGEWTYKKVSDSYSGCCYRIFLDGLWAIAAITTNGNDTIDHRANASLISAAPEMYEALKMVIASVPFADYRGDGELEDVARAVYNAITKAEGRNEE